MFISTVNIAAIFTLSLIFIVLLFVVFILFMETKFFNRLFKILLPLLAGLFVSLIINNIDKKVNFSHFKVKQYTTNKIIKYDEVSSKLFYLDEQTKESKEESFRPDQKALGYDSTKVFYDLPKEQPQTASWLANDFASGNAVIHLHKVDNL